MAVADEPAVEPYPVIRLSKIPKDPRPDWLIEGLWARQGVGVVGGHPKLGKTWGIALSRQYELVWEYAGTLAWKKNDAARLLLADYTRTRPDHPSWLLEHLSAEEREALPRRSAKASLPKRQARHAGSGLMSLLRR